MRKEACQVLAPVIRDGDLHVFEGAALFKHIWQVLSHIHDVLLQQKCIESVQCTEVQTIEPRQNTNDGL